MKLLEKISLILITLTLFCAGGQVVAKEEKSDKAAIQKRIQYLDDYTQTLKREVISLGRFLSDLAWMGAIRSPNSKSATGSGNSKKNTLSTDVMALGQALMQLEDGLLTPPGFQLTVFLSLDTGKDFVLDEIKFSLDDKAAQSKKYNAREVRALHMGGTHRLHIAHLTEGQHQITARYTGGNRENDQYQGEKTFTFEKTAQSKTIELKLESLFGSPKFVIKEWD